VKVAVTCYKLCVVGRTLLKRRVGVGACGMPSLNSVGQVTQVTSTNNGSCTSVVLCRKVLTTGEWTLSVCPPPIQQRPLFPHPLGYSYLLLRTTNFREGTLHCVTPGSNLEKACTYASR